MPQSATRGGGGWSSTSSKLQDGSGSQRFCCSGQSNTVTSDWWKQQYLEGHMTHQRSIKEQRGEETSSRHQEPSWLDTDATRYSAVRVMQNFVSRVETGGQFSPVVHVCIFKLSSLNICWFHFHPICQSQNTMTTPASSSSSCLEIVHFRD